MRKVRFREVELLPKASLVFQMVRNLTAVQEIRVRSLG